MKRYPDDIAAAMAASSKFCRPVIHASIVPSPGVVRSDLNQMDDEAL
jgi:hypothetical protein